MMRTDYESSQLYRSGLALLAFGRVDGLEVDGPSHVALKCLI